MLTFLKKYEGNILVTFLLLIICLICAADFIDRVNDSSHRAINMSGMREEEEETVALDQNAQKMPMVTVPSESEANRTTVITSDKPVMTISFDDNGETVYTEAFPRMEKLGLKGTNYVIANNVGGKGLTTRDQLQQMYDAGWTIGNHTAKHFSLQKAGLSDEEIIGAVKGGRDRIISYGWTKGAGELCAPFNEIDDRIISLVTPYVDSCTNNQQELNNIPFDRLHISRSGVASYPTAVVKSWVDDAIANKKYLHLYFHQIGPGGGLFYPAEDFQTVIEYVAEKKNAGLIEVKTMYELTKKPINYPF